MNFKFINEAFQRHYFNVDVDDHPEVINCGWCYNWAYIAYVLYGGKLCSASLGLKTKDGNICWSLHHSFIKLNHKYYDAEALEGVEDWRTLPTFSFHKTKQLSLKEHYNYKSFWNDWSAHGAVPDVSLIEVLCPSMQISKLLRSWCQP